MPLVDKITQELWKPENVRAMSQYVRRLCQDELRRQDIEAGVPETGQVYQKDEEGKLVVDPELAKKRSSGRELRNLHARRWAKFCSEPQDEQRCEELGFFRDPKSVVVQETRLAESTAECPDELVAAVKIPGLDDADADDTEETEPAADDAPKRDPKRRRRYVGS